jgi:hypothetical protein
MTMVLASPYSGFRHRIAIGTKKAFQEGYAFQYDMIDDGAYVCRTTTETGLEGEVMFFVQIDEGATAWHVACEGTILQDGSFEIRQPCFRTRENFWEAGWHAWECNSSRTRTQTPAYMHAVDPLWDSENVLSCETRHD